MCLAQEQTSTSRENKHSKGRKNLSAAAGSTNSRGKELYKAIILISI